MKMIANWTGFSCINDDIATVGGVALVRNGKERSDCKNSNGQYASEPCNPGTYCISPNQHFPCGKTKQLSLAFPSPCELWTKLKNTVYSSEVHKFTIISNNCNISFNTQVRKWRNLEQNFWKRKMLQVLKRRGFIFWWSGGLFTTTLSWRWVVVVAMIVTLLHATSQFPASASPAWSSASPWLSDVHNCNFNNKVHHRGSLPQMLHSAFVVAPRERRHSTMSVDPLPQWFLGSLCNLNLKFSFFHSSNSPQPSKPDQCTHHCHWFQFQHLTLGAARRVTRLSSIQVYLGR